MEKTGIIAIEGMPGAGKSTFLLKHAHRFGIQTHLLPETNPLPMHSAKKESDFYWSIWIERMIKLSRLKAQEHSFILDRSFYSNLAFVYATQSENVFIRYSSNLFASLENVTPIQKIFLFDINPEIGLKRKKIAGDFIPAPWNQLTFLNRMRDFYKNVLPEFFCGTIHLVPDIEKINLLVNLVDKSPSVTCEPTSEILNFAKKFMLGNPASKCIVYRNIVVRYYREYAVVQPKNEEARFFKNSDIDELLNDM